MERMEADFAEILARIFAAFFSASSCSKRFNLFRSSSCSVPTQVRNHHKRNLETA
jgi:hypothetical protein